MLMDTLKKLLSVYGPTGQESAVAQAIQAMLAGHADSMRTDVMGNLIVEKKGQPGGKTLMFSAHMASIGLVATHIDEDGFIHVGAVGGFAPLRVLFFANFPHGPGNDNCVCAGSMI